MSLVRFVSWALSVQSGDVSWLCLWGPGRPWEGGGRTVAVEGARSSVYGVSTGGRTLSWGVGSYRGVGLQGRKSLFFLRAFLGDGGWVVSLSLSLRDLSNGSFSSSSQNSDG